MKSLIVILVLVVFCVPTLVEANDVTLTPLADTMLLRGNPGNFGTDDNGFVGNWGIDFDYFTLVQWDLPGDLTGETVLSATVTFDINTGEGSGLTDETVYCVPMEKSWGELTANYDTCDGVTPWTGSNAFNDMDFTHTPGYGNGGSHGWASVTHPGDTTITFDVTPMVQDWANGAANYGMGLSLRSDHRGMVSTRTRDHATGGGRLYIDYTPEPATMMLLGVGGLLIRRRR